MHMRIYLVRLEAGPLYSSNIRVCELRRLRCKGSPETSLHRTPLQYVTKSHMLVKLMVGVWVGEGWGNMEESTRKAPDVS